MTSNILDNPVWHALTGPHAAHAFGHGQAKHYPRDIAPFSAIGASGESAYRDLAADLPASTEARLFGPSHEPAPPGWVELDRFPMLQMVSTRLLAVDAGAMSLLTASDIDAMLALVAATKPGPFGRRTPLLGRYLGIRDRGRLVAMAGERLRVPGHVELSAICVHPEARGRCHAAALTSQLVRLAHEAGEVPFLHVRSDNTAAVELYRRLGFEVRRELIVVWRRPQ